MGILERSLRRIVVVGLLGPGCADSGDDSADTAEASGSETQGDGDGTADGGGSQGTGGADDGGTASGDASTSGPGESSTDSSASGDDGTSTSADGGSTTGGSADCDYEVRADGLLVFEAESLPLVEDWEVGTQIAGYYGTGYISWTGPSLNNSPGTGLLEVAMGISEPGRYRVQWRTRIGMGSDATEHNDVWLRFPDVVDYYGKRDDGAQETRRYPRPICEDAGFIAGIEALPEVSGATCAAGSTSEGWLKVYSSGATDWRWSTRTSDSDAHDIHFEIDAPGTYTMQLSARADHSLLDRVVVHREAVDDADVHDEANPQTPCP